MVRSMSSNKVLVENISFRNSCRLFTLLVTLKIGLTLLIFKLA